MPAEPIPAAAFPAPSADVTREELEAVYDAAAAFVSTTSVFRQRKESRPEFEALATSLLSAFMGAMGRSMGDVEA